MKTTQAHTLEALISLGTRLGSIEEKLDRLLVHLDTVDIEVEAELEAMALHPSNIITINFGSEEA